MRSPIGIDRSLSQGSSNSECLSAGDSRSEIIWVDPERMRGVPCIAGTRVPVKALFDHLKSGISLGEFLDQFEGVPRQVCIRTIELAYERLIEDLAELPGSR